MRLPRKMRPAPRTDPSLAVTVFAAGCFNRVHAAHVRLLKQARVLGDRLVVVISNDRHNRKPNAVPAARRKKRIEALAVADQVIIGDADGFAGVLRREKPRVLVLGYDQRLPDRETENAVREMDIEMVVMPWFPGKEDASSSSCR
ncbi:MAG: adenylyltransferase/cytidyltransferase family protein [Elusimicrobiota bacterium]